MNKMQHNFTWQTPNWFRVLCLTLLVALTGIGASAQTATIGTGTISSGTTGNSPVNGYWNYAHYQVVYTAAQITAAGMPSGATITALGWSVLTAYGGGALQNYTIRLAHTTATNCASNIPATLTIVKNAFSYTPVVQTAGNFQMITFDNNFVWDGTSNILVDVCMGSNPYTAPYGAVRTTTTTNGSNNIFCDGCGSQCGNAVNTVVNRKPNIRFSYSNSVCSGTPAPGNTLANPASVCQGSTTALSLQNATVGSGVAYQWYNGAGLIAGATSSTYSPVINAVDNFYCNVTCSGVTTASNSVTVGLNPFYNCYCASGATYTADEEIYNVTLNGSSTNPLYANANGCTTVAPGPGSVLSSYSNFKTLGALTSFEQGALVPFSVDENECDGATYFANGISIWIDFNHNGSFADAGEQVYVEPSTVTSPQTVSGTFTVPMTALTGLTAMRVIAAEGYSGASLTPCFSYGYGETEDYLVNILQAVPCAGTPNPGNTLANGTAGTVYVCPGTVNFSLQNFTSGTSVSYQWNNLNGPIPGATNALYSQLITSPDEIYCDVTCSGNPTVSSGVSYVNVNSFLVCYCQPTMFPTNPTCSWINSLTTTGAVADIVTAVDAGFGAPGFTYYPSTGLTVASGASFNLNVQATGSCNIAYFSVWIDYNQNGIFESSELMVNNVSTANVATTFPIAVPGSALNGVTRMRVIDWTNGLPFGPCDNLSGYYGETEDYLINIVPLPATPDAPIEVGVPNCATGGTLMSGGTAPAGVTWYWESTATGTSTAQPVSSNLTILSNGTYYVRAQDNTYLTWSTASSSITVTDFPVGPADPSTAASGGNPACGSVTLLSSPALAGTTNYWQGTNAVGTSTSSIADDVVNNYPYVASTNGIYYIRAQDNVSFCWSNPIPTTVSIYALPTAPVLSATPATICPGSTSALTAIAPSAPAANYSTTSITYGYQTPVSPITVFAAGSGWDDSYSSSISLPFAFNFYGNTYSSLTISTNGYVQFSGGATTSYGEIIPNATAPNDRIAGVHNDLISGTSGAISYFTTGTAPNRIFVVEFANCSIYGAPGNYSFQIEMFESTGIMEVHVAEASGSASDGTAKTIGVENATGTLAAFPANRNGANASWDIPASSPEAYRFSPIQPFGFMWTPNGAANGINAGDEILPNITVNPTSSINYTMTITDPAHGCQNASSIAVNVVPIAPAPITTGASTPCGSSTVTLTATGTGGTLRWYTAPVGGTLVASGTSSFTTPLINATTTYYVEEYNGACAGPRTAVTATYTPSTSVTASSNVPAVCAGGPAILTASSANSNYTYTWEPGTLTGSSVTVNPLVNTTYTLTGVDGACVNVATVTVLSGANPNILSVTATPGTMCAGATSQLNVVVGTSAPTTYCTSLLTSGNYCGSGNLTNVTIQGTTLNNNSVCNWTAANGDYSSYPASGSSTAGLIMGQTYTISVSCISAAIVSMFIDYNHDGQFSASEWIQVYTSATTGTASFTVPSGAIAGPTGMRVRSRLSGNINGSGDQCLSMGSGSTDDYTITLLSPTFNYSWTGSGLSSATAYNPTATPSATDTYTVTVADATTGCTSTGSVVLNVIQLAPAPSVTGGATACGVGPVVLSASGTGGTLNWYNAPTGGTLVNTGSTYTTTAISSTTTYYVDETVGACTGPRAAVVATFTPSPVVTASSNVSYVCVGGANNTAVLTASSSNASYSYTWQPGGMTGASVTVTPTATTIYTVTGVDGPCSNIATVVVIGGVVPVINSTIASPSNFCGSGTSQLLVDAGQLAPTYCTPTVFYTGASGDYIESFTFNTISNLFSGDNPSDYSLYSQATTVLPGSTYALTATPGAAWGQGVGVWIDYNRNGSFADAGEFVFSSASGIATVSGNITIPASASSGLSRIRVCSMYGATPASTDYCGHSGYGEYEDYNITIGNGSGGLTFAWTPAAGLSNASDYNPTATVSVTTTYNVSVSDSYGCAATSSATITVNQPSSSNTSMTTCAPIAWNGNTYATAGTYSFITTNAAGCDSVATLNLTIACSTVVNLTCLIQGYWDAGSSAMLPVLANQGETSTATACDSIDVELRDITTYAMVQSVRTVLNQNGTANCVFPATTGDYYIVVKHRSAIQTWSALPVTVGSTAVSYNFTTAANQAFGDNQVEVSTGVWALYSGDIIIDENIDLLDLGTLELDISNFSYGYIPTDLNGDGNVDLLDSPVVEANISNFVFSYHP